MSSPLLIIPGKRRGTYSLGYVAAGKPFRDERFSPLLTEYEANYLLKSEMFRAEVERIMRNRTPTRWVT